MNNFNENTHQNNNARSLRNFIKNSIVIIILLILIIATGIMTPLSLKSFNGISALVKTDEEREFAKNAIIEANSMFDKLQQFLVWRVKIVKIARDVPICGKNEKYIAFVKAYTFFNVPYVAHVMVESLDMNPNYVGGSMAIKFSQLKQFMNSPADAFNCP